MKIGVHLLAVALRTTRSYGYYLYNVFKIDVAKVVLFYCGNIMLGN